MSAPETKQVELPESLQQQFKLLEKRLWRVETAQAVALGLGGAFLAYDLMFLGDRVGETPGLLRLVFLTVGVGAVTAAVVRWSRHWVLKRRDWRQLARLVQKKYRVLGDRLLGIVELADEKKRPAHFSPELYQAAIEQVAQQAAPHDFRRAVASRSTRRLATAAGLLGLVALVPFVVVPAVGWNSLLRLVSPLGQLPRQTLVSLEGVPQQLVVPHGEGFALVAQVRYRSFWHPKRATARFGKLPPVYGEVRNGQVRWQIPGKILQGPLLVQVGDGREQVQLLPSHRPSLKDLSASIAYPDYLNYPPRQEPVPNGTLSLVEGSQATLQGQATRTLAQARMQRQDSEEPAQNLPVAGETFSTPALSTEGVVQFHWLDTLGLTNASPWRLTVQTQKDEPPRPELLEMPREIAMLQSEVLDLKVVGQDDFGIRALGYTWDFTPEYQATNGPSNREVRRQAATPREKRWQANFGFSPSLLGIPEDTVVELQALANDYFPGRQPIESVSYRVQILGKAKHAEAVRQQLEGLLARLEEVTRLEEKIASGAREVKEQLQSDKAAERLGDLKEEQAQNALNLEELAQAGARTLREAVRNPSFKEETVKEWAQNLQEMQRLSQKTMKESTDSLQSAQQQASKRAESLAQAQEKMDETVKALEKMQKKVNKDLDQLQALTLSQRLSKLGGEEKKIEEKLQGLVPDTVGLLPAELSVPQRKANETLGHDQDRVGRESRLLLGELSRFAERTGKTNYATVSREMTEAHTGEEMEQLQALILDNVSMEASRQLVSWFDRFNQWARRLEPPPQDSSKQQGGGEGEGAQQQDQTLKQLMALLRLRERQVNVREQTRILEEQKPPQATYEQGVKVLVENQRHLTGEMDKLASENKQAALKKPLGEIVESAMAAQGLLETPQTGAPTEAAQTRTVDFLSDAINLINEEAQKKQQQQQSGSSGNQADDMKFLMQMMAQQPGQGQGMAPAGQSPGGNESGGDTQQKSPFPAGDVRGKNGEARKVGKGSGMAGMAIPNEFRDAMEGYFKGVEGEAN